MRRVTGPSRHKDPHYSSETRPKGAGSAVVGANRDGVSLGARAAPVAFTEFIHAPARVHHFLLARIERVAVGADLDVEIAGQRRSGRELIPAAADYFEVAVFWVNVRFHGMLGPIGGRVSILLESPQHKIARARYRESGLGPEPKARNGHGKRVLSTITVDNSVEKTLGWPMESRRAEIFLRLTKKRPHDGVSYKSTSYNLVVMIAYSSHA